MEWKGVPGAWWMLVADAGPDEDLRRLAATPPTPEKKGRRVEREKREENKVNGAE